jgi:hypothetical protein
VDGPRLLLTVPVLAALAGLLWWLGRSVSRWLPASETPDAP